MITTKASVKMVRVLSEIAACDRLIVSETRCLLSHLARLWRSDPCAYACLLVMTAEKLNAIVVLEFTVWPSGHK
jgi:hypothetical protein